MTFIRIRDRLKDTKAQTECEILASKRCFLGGLVPVIGRANRGRANDFSAATLDSATPAGTLGSGEIWPKSREIFALHT
jgi:hypothetical protein